MSNIPMLSLEESHNTIHSLILNNWNYIFGEGQELGNHHSFHKDRLLFDLHIYDILIKGRQRRHRLGSTYILPKGNM